MIKDIMLQNTVNKSICDSFENKSYLKVVSLVTDELKKNPDDYVLYLIRMFAKNNASNDIELIDSINAFYFDNDYKAVLSYCGDSEVKKHLEHLKQQRVSIEKELIRRIDEKKKKEIIARGILEKNSAYTKKMSELRDEALNNLIAIEKLENDIGVSATIYNKYLETEYRGFEYVKGDMIKLRNEVNSKKSIYDEEVRGYRERISSLYARKTTKVKAIKDIKGIPFVADYNRQIEEKKNLENIQRNILIKIEKFTEEEMKYGAELSNIIQLYEGAARNVLGGNIQKAMELLGITTRDLQQII